MYHGDIRLGDTIDIKFTTRQVSGAPTTLAGSPVISAYPGNSTTQLTAGITLSVDFDAVTGLHNVRVVATSGNGYATATNYVLVITTGTVNSVSVVGEVVGSFSIEARSAVMPTTAARTLDVSATGEAGVDWANVGGPTTAVDLSGTTIKTTQKVDVDTIKTNPVVNGGTITFPTTATLASTTNITAGTVTTATNVTTVNGLAANVVTAAAIADGAIDAATFAAGAINAAAIADSAIDRATFAADTGLQTFRSNTAAAGASGTITLDASASATNDFYKGALVVLTGGTGVGQARVISSYVGATKVASITPNWATTPDGTSTFAICSNNEVDLLVRLGAPAGASVSADIASVSTLVGAVSDQVGVTTGLIGLPTSGNLADDLRAGVTVASGGIQSTSFAANAIDSSALAASAVDEIVDEVVEGSYTIRQYLRLFAAVLAGKLSGAATTTVAIRDTGDLKNRVSATVDANGNRSAVTIDVS